MKIVYRSKEEYKKGTRNINTKRRSHVERTCGGFTANRYKLNSMSGHLNHFSVFAIIDFLEANARAQHL